MSKSKKTYKYYDDDDDYVEVQYNYEEYRERKKNKKLSHALKTKSIDDLIQIDEEDF